MTAMLFLVNALTAAGLILLILLQRSDPATGGAFGGMGGGNQPIIRNPLAKPTAILAGIFLVTCLLIAYTQKGRSHHDSVIQEHMPEEPVTTAPATPALPEPTLVAPAAEAPATAPVLPTETLPATQ